jgi:hypothetical protein
MSASAGTVTSSSIYCGHFGLLASLILQDRLAFNKINAMCSNFILLQVPPFLKPSHIVYVLGS